MLYYVLKNKKLIIYIGYKNYYLVPVKYMYIVLQLGFKGWTWEDWGTRPWLIGPSFYAVGCTSSKMGVH